MDYRSGTSRIDRRHAWCERLGPAGLAEWRRTGVLGVWHFGYAEKRWVHIELLDDARSYDENRLDRPLSILLMHGRHDETVDVQSSVAFAATRPNVKLEIYDTDHGMIDVLSQLWESAAAFCGLEG